MENISKKFYRYALTALPVIASSAAYASQAVTVPTLEGGITAEIGTFYVVPSANNTLYNYTEQVFLSTYHGETADITLENANGEYNWGFDAALGYIFEDTANGIELSYRGIDSDTNITTDSLPDYLIGEDEVTDVSANDKLKYELNSADLMLSQYINLGNSMQLRLSAGAAYVNLKQEQVFTAAGLVQMPPPAASTSPALGKEDMFTGNNNSRFSGAGPRLAMDARYDFGQGFGILAGASVAYLLGTTDLDIAYTSITDVTIEKLITKETSFDASEEFNNQAVTNLRGNVGVDYVYFFDNEDRSTIGLELGYMVDYYADAVQYINPTSLETTKNAAPSPFPSTFLTQTTAVTFSGPYLNLKGVF